MKEKKISAERIFRELDKGVGFNSQLDLYETVRLNEDFFIGRQWEGVQSNGLPTPVFNFLKRIVLFLVASVATDNIKISASALSSTGPRPTGELERLCQVIDAQFTAVFEGNKVSKHIREFSRNAAVDGDGCFYTWFDPEAETGQAAKGAIRMEVMENTRVIFGNPNSADVQRQPYILISRRLTVEEIKNRAKEHKGDAEHVKGDADENNDRFDTMAGDKATLVTRFWRDERSGTIHAVEAARDAVVRPEWDTGLKLYPIVWMSWDYVPNCYHGQSAVTGLIPNQIFVNKAYAMTMISLMTTAYPKVIYDSSRVPRWDSRVGAAIGVKPGDNGLNDVAKVMDPAVISPQVSQFIEAAIRDTKEFMGATDAALGSVKPENTSAILALQKASSVPLELVRQNLYQCLEDLANIWLDMMRVYYGRRYVELPPPEDAAPLPTVPGVSTPALEQYMGSPRPALFDFSTLNDVALSLKLDVGGSAYWSEIAQLQTLDNLLAGGHISIVDYLERIPNGYIINQQELIDKLKAAMQRPQPAPAPAGREGGPLEAIQQKLGEIGQTRPS